MERSDPLDTTDIQGATTRRLPSRSTPHPFNTNEDIDFSRPFSRTTHPKSQRSTNPLVPAYVLPSSTYVPVVEAKGPPRDTLWTLPQPNWKPETRHPQPMTDAELYGRQHLFRKLVPSRTSLVSADITGPQFRLEEKTNRITDPLHPVYIYDGGQLDDVNPRRPRYGSMYTRSPAENYSLRTDDICARGAGGDEIFSREYPKELIKTRPSNRTDDILGAQANTWCSYPRLWKYKDPSNSVEKVTNRVLDIEGAVAGTAGQGPPLYRTRLQASKISASTRAAEIASVRALH